MICNGSIFVWKAIYLYVSGAFWLNCDKVHSVIPVAVVSAALNITPNGWFYHCLSTIIYHVTIMYEITWGRHQMETFSKLLAICAENSPGPGEFPAQRPMTRSFDVFFDLRLNKWLNKQSGGWWFETLSHPLWRHRNERMVHVEYISHHVNIPLIMSDATTGLDQK